MSEGIKLVQVLQGAVKTSSVRVAEVFGKQHKDVLRAIRNLDVVDNKKVNDFNGRNFAPIDFIDKNGAVQSGFEMTRDGFTSLALGFTGDKAKEFQIDYIEAFNVMEKELARVSVTKALEGNVAERARLGVSVRRGLSQRQWSELYSVMEGMANGDGELNAVHSYFSRYFGAGSGSNGSVEPIAYDLALGYLDRLRAAFKCGYVPVYRGGRLVVEEDLL
jgi:Rha family phage regulatory protein